MRKTVRRAPGTVIPVMTCCGHPGSSAILGLFAADGLRGRLFEAPKRAAASDRIRCWRSKSKGKYSPTSNARHRRHHPCDQQPSNCCCSFVHLLGIARAACVPARPAPQASGGPEAAAGRLPGEPAPKSLARFSARARARRRHCTKSYGPAHRILYYSGCDLQHKAKRHRVPVVTFCGKHLAQCWGRGRFV
jgi:hypothetical protein